MAAKFGSILSDLSGDAGQILKVNSGGTAFEMATPPSLPTYTVTNDSVDRVIDANDVTLDELADVVSTLIKDMATIYDGGGISAFTWSTSEQVYPFEKNSSGNIVYCREINFGSLPNAGLKQVAHGISGLNTSNVFRWELISTDGTGNSYSTHYADDGTARVAVWLDATNINVVTFTNRSGGVGKARILYAK